MDERTTDVPSYRGRISSVGREFDEREIAGSNPTGPTLRGFKELRRKSCLCNDICKQLDFLVFSDKHEKP